mgnify:CR=1 FL=1
MVIIASVSAHDPSFYWIENYQCGGNLTFIDMMPNGTDYQYESQDWCNSPEMGYHNENLTLYTDYCCEHHELRFFNGLNRSGECYLYQGSFMEPYE